MVPNSVLAKDVLPLPLSHSFLETQLHVAKKGIMNSALPMFNTTYIQTLPGITLCLLYGLPVQSNPTFTVYPCLGPTSNTNLQHACTRVRSTSLLMSSHMPHQPTSS